VTLIVLHCQYPNRISHYSWIKGDAYSMTTILNRSFEKFRYITALTRDFPAVWNWKYENWTYIADQRNWWIGHMLLTAREKRPRSSGLLKFEFRTSLMVQSLQLTIIGYTLLSRESDWLISPHREGQALEIVDTFFRTYRLLTRWEPTVQHVIYTRLRLRLKIIFPDARIMSRNCCKLNATINEIDF
jgi:hypothetical protein